MERKLQLLLSHLEFMNHSAVYVQVFYFMCHFTPFTYNPFSIYVTFCWICVQLPLSPAVIKRFICSSVQKQFSISDKKKDSADGAGNLLRLYETLIDSLINLGNNIFCMFNSD